MKSDCSMAGNSAAGTLSKEDHCCITQTRQTLPASQSPRAMRRRGVAVIDNSLASTEIVPVHSKSGRYRKPQLPAGARLQAPAAFRAGPEARFVHNGDVHFRKLCLRRETLVGSKQTL